MKYKLKPECQSCKTVRWVSVHLDDHLLEWTCQACGHINYGFFELDVTIGHKILARSGYEANIEKDYSMSVVLSAMAFECEVARLFIKWKEIEGLKKAKNVSKGDLEEEYRKLWKVTKRIKETAKLMRPGGLADFVRKSPELSKTIVSNFPSLHIGSLAEDFEKLLFYPRNKILHFGYARYRKDDAERCHSIAQFGLHLLRQMDLAKRKTI